MPHDAAIYSEVYYLILWQFKTYVHMKKLYTNIHNSIIWMVKLETTQKQFTKWQTGNGVRLYNKVEFDNKKGWSVIIW